MKFQIVKKIANRVTVKTGKVGLKMRKHAPELCIGAGIGCFVLTAVEASKATLHAQDILERYHSQMEDAREALKAAKEMEEEFDMGREKLLIYSKTFIDVAKLYAPSIVLGGLSIGFIVASRNILHSRYLAAVGAFNAVSEAFTNYRTSVREELGDIYDRHFRYGTELETITKEVVDENGKKKKVKEVVEKENSVSEHVKGNVYWFDEFNQNGEKNYQWDRNPEFSESFLSGRMAYLNDRFHDRGKMFLNEVLDDLGLEMTTEGALTGWVMGNGDNYIDFGDIRKNAKLKENGISKAYLLEFNCDGFIYDKI